MTEIIKTCLNDVINLVEKNNKSLPTIMAIDKISNLIIIDLEKLKNNPRLKGAKIFKHLFGIKPMLNFKHETPKTDQRGYYTILKTLDILRGEWMSLIQILETGHPFYYIEYKDYNYKGRFQMEMYTIQRISIKLGGIPYIDKYFMNVEKNDYSNIPRVPEEDVDGLYQWTATTSRPTSVDLNLFANTHSSEDGWSLSTIRNNRHYYYREWETDNNSTVSSEATHLVYPESDASTDAPYNSEEDTLFDY